MSKFISTTNFDEISQSAAELLILPVSENGRPPCHETQLVSHSAAATESRMLCLFVVYCCVTDRVKLGIKIKIKHLKRHSLALKR